MMPSASAAGEGNKVPVPGPCHHPRALSPSQSLVIVPQPCHHPRTLLSASGAAPSPSHPPPPSTRRAGAGNFSSAFRHPGRLQLTKPCFPLPRVHFLRKTNAGRCGCSRSCALDHGQLQDIFLPLSPAGQKQASKCRRGGAQQLPSTPFPFPAVFPSLSLPCEREEARGRGGERGRVPAPSAKAAAGWMPGPEHTPTAPRARSCSTPQQNAAWRENPAPSQGWITEAGS